MPTGDEPAVPVDTESAGIGSIRRRGVHHVNPHAGFALPLCAAPNSAFPSVYILLHFAAFNYSATRTAGVFCFGNIMVQVSPSAPEQCAPANR